MFGIKDPQVVRALLQESLLEAKELCRCVRNGANKDDSQVKLRMEVNGMDSDIEIKKNRPVGNESYVHSTCTCKKAKKEKECWWKSFICFGRRESNITRTLKLTAELKRGVKG